VLVAVVTTGLAFAISFGLIHISAKSLSLSRWWILPIANVAGLAAIALSRLALSRFAHREDAEDARREAAQATFIRSMQRLEIEGTQAASDKLKRDPDAISLGVMLRVLADMGVWSAHDVSEFRRLMRTRNVIVHDEEPIDLAALETSVKEARRLQQGLSTTGDDDKTVSR